MKMDYKRQQDLDCVLLIGKVFVADLEVRAENQVIDLGNCGGSRSCVSFKLGGVKIGNIKETGVFLLKGTLGFLNWFLGRFPGKYPDRFQVWDMIHLFPDCKHANQNKDGKKG